MTASHSNRTTAASAGPPREVPGRGRIVRVDADIRLAAVDRLLAGAGPDGAAVRIGRRARPEGVTDASLAQAERFIAFTSANGIRIDAMWAIVSDAGVITDTVLAVPNPGRTAILFTSTPDTRSAIDPLAALIGHACLELGAMEVDLAQVLLDPRQRLQRDALLAAGFAQLARLSYMERALSGRRRHPAPRWPDGVTVAPYDASQRDELLDVLEASYEDTLDCPGLRGLRRTEDILAGHQGTGDFDPTMWTMLRIDGKARGALLLSRSPASDAIELVYIGLAAAARGRGLGRELLRHGLHLVDSRPERSITLAVDESNHPAIALYRGEGFRAVLGRLALIRSLRAHV